MGLIKKTEDMFIINLKRITLVSIFTALLLMVLNVSNINLIWNQYVNGMEKTLHDYHKNKRYLESLNEILLNSTGMLGKQVPLLNQFIRNSSGKKVLAISSNKDKEYFRRIMKNIAKNLSEKTKNVDFIYITDYKADLKDNIYNKHIKLNMNDLNIGKTPMIIVLDDDNGILQRYAINEKYTPQVRVMLEKTMINVLKKL